MVKSKPKPKHIISENEKKYGKPDSDRLGLFGEMSYISSEPFVNQKFEMLGERTKGKQFITNPNKKGHYTKDVYFGKNETRLFENEAYNDIIKIKRRAKLESKKLNISDQPFRPASVCPGPSGQGSIYGTFKHEFPLPDENKPIKFKPTPDEKERSKEKHEIKKNFVTKPGKKGSGFGYANITIGKDYEYISDPIDAALELNKKEKALMKEKLANKKPFIPGSHKNDLFSPFTGLAPQNMDKKDGDKNEKSRNIHDKDKEIEKQPPFKPTNYNNGTINKYPNHETPIKNNQTELSPQEKIEQLKKSSPIFKPAGGTKPFPIRSIIASNVPIAPPTWIRSSLKSYSSI